MSSGISSRLRKIWHGLTRGNEAGAKEDIPLTYGLIAFLSVIYFIELCATQNGFSRTAPDGAALVALGGLSKPLVMNSIEWYRVMISPFLNGSFTALAFNLFALFLLGSAFERMFGRLWLTAFVILCAAIGSLFSLAMNTASTVSVGTAGVMTGLSLTLYIVSFTLKADERIRLQVRVLCTMALFLWPMVNAIQHNNHILNYGAHIGGILFGSAFGGMMLKKWKAASPPLFTGWPDISPQSVQSCWFLPLSRPRSITRPIKTCIPPSPISLRNPETGIDVVIVPALVILAGLAQVLDEVAWIAGRGVAERLIRDN